MADDVLDHQSAISELLGNPAPAPVVPEPAEPAEAPAPAPVVEGNEPAAPAEPEPKPNDTPSPDIFSHLATISEGAVNTEDDFRSILENSRKAADLESRLTELGAQLESAKTANPFANDYIKKLNELVASGADQQRIEVFERINKLGDIKELGTYDALLFDLQRTEGLTRDEAVTLLRSQYKTDPDKFDEEDIAVDKIRMKMDGEKAKERLLQDKASFDTVTPASKDPVETPEQKAQKQAEFIGKVTPVVQSISQELPSYFKSINVNGKQGADAVSIELPVPADIQKAVSESVLAYATQAGVDDKAALTEYAQNITKLAMFDAWIIDASNKREEALRAEFHNPDVINRGVPNPATPGVSPEAATASLIASTF